MDSNNRLKIQLINEPDNSLFAQALIQDENYDPFVQRCYDSSRFFALVLVSDSGQRAMIGIGFPERNDSFDFVAALTEFSKQIKISKGIIKPVSATSTEKDYSLKQGETLTLNIGGLIKPS
mmetsp:Transcript_28188/g.21074  ORF Transcript_28188/g.21074 Transcript_28188/m.21074 type:complete len:121 (+) Transcript_28188:140-502(+)